MNIITAIDDFINNTRNKINEIAIKTGFKIREGKIKPETFVTALTVGQVALHEITLDTLAGKCEDYQKDLIVSRQAVFDRMEVGSSLLKEVYLQTFNDVTEKNYKLENIEVLKQFKDIKITDGTTIALPDKLKDVYKGLGGTNSISAVKIQTTYSVFRHEFVGLDDFSATKNDATYNEMTIESIEAGELSIKDLGYYCVEYFQSLDNKKAYFLSRIKTNCVLYDMFAGEYKTLDIEKILKNSNSKIDKRYFLKQQSTESMYEVRVTGLKLPIKVSDERKRKANKNAEKNGKQLSSKEIELLNWFLVITNVPEDMLTVETIGELYRLRWQIELQFKALKSSMDFDKFGKAGEHYFKCLFYGRLTMLLLTMRIFSICRAIKFKESRRLVSIQKFVKNFRSNLNPLICALLNPIKKLLVALEQKILRVAQRSVFDRRNRKTTEETLMNHDLPESVLSMLVDGKLESLA
jgi:Transposase DDE domain